MGNLGAVVTTSDMSVDDRVLSVLNRSLGAGISAQEWRQMTTLDESFGMDSMAVLEFVAGLEQEFGIRFPPEDLVLELFNNRARLVAYLDGRLDSAARTSA